MLVAGANCVEVGVLDAIFGCRDGCGRWSKEAESGSLTIREDDGIAVHYRKNGMSERINEALRKKSIYFDVGRGALWSLVSEGTRKAIRGKARPESTFLTGGLRLNCSPSLLRLTSL